jgi:hypothetical protein
MADGKSELRQAFKHLEEQVPDRFANILRRLRHPDARLLRIPLGLLLVVGGVFSILPVLGIWMLPLGLLLLAYDVPFLRKPVARFTIWATQKWAAFRHRSRGSPLTEKGSQDVKHSRGNEPGTR